MSARLLPALALCALGWASLANQTIAAAVQESGTAKRVTWDDVAALAPMLEAQGITAARFESHVEDLARANARRVREGDLDHLVFYLLQSTRFTSLPPIEPALSAKAFVETRRVPEVVKSRAAGLVRAVALPSPDPRLSYFRDLVNTALPDERQRIAGLLREYERVMRFVYEKEFVAQRSERPADAVSELYRSRGLSTDTAVEAGYLVHLGLAILKSLEPDRRVRRVLIVGPGLDLAPRTGFSEAGPPVSYQPWTVLDAVLDLRLSEPGHVSIVAADINPRVVEHLRRSRRDPPTLMLTSGIQESDTVALSQEYRDYLARLGSAIGTPEAGSTTLGSKFLHKRVQVSLSSSEALHAERLDIVTERLREPPFDVVIATNILPYFGDVELTLALSNIASMLASGGVFLHNEPRPVLGEIAEAVGLPFEQARQAVIATVRGAPGPLVDRVFLHRRKAPGHEVP